MKQWVQKLIDQLEYKEKVRPKLSEERATLMYLLDVYNKNLFEIDSHPIRRVREQFDEFTREVVSAERADLEKTLFRLRQYFSSYRVAEAGYIRKTFEDFKGIIWNFVEQLSEDFADEQAEDKEMSTSLEQLKEAVEADSVDLLRTRSLEFINSYKEHQSKREQRRSKRMKSARKNLDLMKRQLDEAGRSLKVDHLTGAFNRRHLDERIREVHAEFLVDGGAHSMIIVDIDHFKKINDGFGHDVGDFVLKELVGMMHEVFDREGDFVARMGGEEFAVLLPKHSAIAAVKRAEDMMARIRKEVFIQQGRELRFTASMGISQLHEGESFDNWMKRADVALYNSKNTGRNRYTVAEPGAAAAAS